MSKTIRKEYTGSKAFDTSCRSHGSCPWCEGARVYKHKKRAPVGYDRMRGAKKSRIHI